MNTFLLLPTALRQSESVLYFSPYFLNQNQPSKTVVTFISINAKPNLGQKVLYFVFHFIYIFVLILYGERMNGV